jgi:hypothetical protein
MRIPLAAKKKFRLSAEISTNNPAAIKPVIQRLIGSTGTMNTIHDGFEIQANLEGRSARELNRMLLSEMRRVEKKTRLRAEWTYRDTVENFFDYVPKGRHKLKRV